MNINPISKQEFRYSIDDITLLRNSALAFFVAHLLSIVMNFFLPSLVSVVVRMGGTIIFALGIFVFSNKYPRLSKGKIVSALFIAEVSFEIITYVIDIENTDPAVITFLISSFIISSGLVILTAYIFTQWFNDMLSSYSLKSNVFLYYGVLLFIGQVISTYGIYSMGNDFITFIISETISDAFLLEHSQSIMIIGIGSLFIIVAGFTLIIASYLIYSRVNNIFTLLTVPQYDRKIAPTTITTTIKTTKDSLPSHTTDVQWEDISDDQRKFCGTCGKSVSQGSSFCESCGAKIK
jgi:hypothetical protein